jgi:hypothetical protein
MVPAWTSSVSGRYLRGGLRVDPDEAEADEAEADLAEAEDADFEDADFDADFDDADMGPPWAQKTRPKTLRAGSHASPAF